MPSSFRPSSSSSSSSSRSLVASAVLAILLLELFQIWLFTGGHSCRVTAIRVLPREGAVAARVMKTSHDVAAGHSSKHVSSISSSSTSYNKDNYGVSNTEHFRSYFSAPPSSSSGSSTAAVAVAVGGGFEESKRKVPSCPDPLHN